MGSLDISKSFRWHPLPSKWAISKFESIMIKKAKSRDFKCVMHVQEARWFPNAPSEAELINQFDVNWFYSL